MIKIYSKPDCDWCDKAKQLLNDMQIPYKEYIYEVDYTKEELKNLIGHDKKLTVPQIFINNKYVGGYQEMISYMEDHGMFGLRN